MKDSAIPSIGFTVEVTDSGTAAAVGILERPVSTIPLLHVLLESCIVDCKVRTPGVRQEDLREVENGCGLTAATHDRDATAAPVAATFVAPVSPGGKDLPGRVSAADGAAAILASLIDSSAAVAGKSADGGCGAAACVCSEGSDLET